jgi:hypothetical protein
VYAEALEFQRYSEAGYKLVYLDMTQLYFADTYTSYGSGNKEYVVSMDGSIVCKSREEVISAIREYSARAWFFILHHSYTRDISEGWLFRAFKKYNCDYILTEIANVPEGISKQANIRRHLLSRAYTLLKQLQFGGLLRRTGNWIFLFLMGRDVIFRKPALCFTPGTIGYHLFKTIYPWSEVVNIPSLNYCKYRNWILKLKDHNDSNMPTYDYLLYLDQSIFDSPDNKLVGKHTIYKDLFFKEINNFFDRLEKLTGKRVVIGASPKYHYTSREYQCRDIVYNKTVELTAKADMVIVHTTSAVDYAIMMHKPIIFLIVEGFSDKIIDELQSFAFALKRPVVNSGEGLDIGKMNEFPNVDKEIYNTYISNYLTTEVFDVSFNEIIIEKMRERNGVI